MTSLIYLVAYSLLIFQFLKLIGMLVYWIRLHIKDPLAPENAVKHNVRSAEEEPLGAHEDAASNF